MKTSARFYHLVFAYFYYFAFTYRFLFRGGRAGRNVRRRAMQRDT